MVSTIAEVPLTAVFKEVAEGGYIAYIAEMNGVNTQGETLKEAEENLVEAYLLMIECSKEEVKNQSNISTTPFLPMLKNFYEKTKTG